MYNEINQHLECVLRSHSIENDQDLISSYRKKKGDLKNLLSTKFSSDIYYTFDSGSYKKSTAINTKFDLDICVPFKKNGNTLESNYDAIYNYFADEYDDSELIRGPIKQKVSIGLEYLVNDKYLDFDIVPGREINDYEKDYDLNLYVNESFGLFEPKSHIKTNIHKQVDHIRDHSEAREIIKLLKIWRSNTGHLALKSFLLELIVIRAFQDNTPNIPSGLWEKLKTTLVYISNNIKTISLIDPGNSNNNVTDSLSEYQKIDVSNTLNRIINNVEDEESSIENYFPVNPDHPCDEANNSPYILIDRNEPDRIPDNDFG